jgi:hypothetical protein
MYERHKARVYFCDLCGRSVTLLPERRGYGAPGYWLPEGWTGSYRKRGCCLCPECSEAVRAEKERQERLDAALRYSVVVPWDEPDMKIEVPGGHEGDSEAQSCECATERPDDGSAGARGAEGGPEGGVAGGR